MFELSDLLDSSLKSGFLAILLLIATVIVLIIVCSMDCCTKTKNKYPVTRQTQHQSNTMPRRTHNEERNYGSGSMSGSMSDNSMSFGSMSGSMSDSSMSFGSMSDSSMSDSSMSNSMTTNQKSINIHDTKNFNLYCNGCRVNDYSNKKGN